MAWTAGLLTEALGAAREAGARGIIVVRADSAYYNGAFIATCRRAGVAGAALSSLGKTNVNT